MSNANEATPRPQADESILRLLEPMAAVAGIDVPGAERLVPQINLDAQTIRVVEQLGGLLSRCDVFARGDECVTVENGEIKPVSPARFCTLIERYVTCIKYGAQGPRVVTMGVELAVKILQSLDFIRLLPPLEGVVTVSLPVRRADGRIEWLAKGYDRESRVWCEDAIKYPREMPVGEAMHYLWGLFGEYPWAREGGEDASWLFGNRNFCAQLAAMLSTYSRLLLPAGSPRPMFIWVANQQGSGKSVLAEASIAHVCGDVAASDVPTEKRDMEQLLASTAQALSPYLLLDDAPQFVISNALNRFVTAQRHRGRILGSPLCYDVPNVTQVLMTSNNLEMTPDLMRRAVFVELFVDVDIETRQIGRAHV